MGRFFDRLRGTRDDGDEGDSAVKRDLQTLKQEYRANWRLLLDYQQVLRERQGLQPGQVPTPDGHLLTLRVREAELLSNLKAAAARAGSGPGEAQPQSPEVEQTIARLQREARSALDAARWEQAESVLEEWARLAPRDPQAEVLREEARHRRQVAELLASARDLAQNGDIPSLEQALAALDQVLAMEERADARTLREEIDARLAQAVHAERQRVLAAVAAALDEGRSLGAHELLDTMPPPRLYQPEEEALERTLRARLKDALAGELQEVRIAIQAGGWDHAQQLLDEWTKVMPGDPEAEALRQELEERRRLAGLLDNARSLIRAGDIASLQQAKAVLEEVLKEKVLVEARALQDEVNTRLAVALQAERERAEAEAAAAEAASGEAAGPGEETSAAEGAQQGPTEEPPEQTEEAQPPTAAAEAMPHRPARRFIPLLALAGVVLALLAVAATSLAAMRASQSAATPTAEPTPALPVVPTATIVPPTPVPTLAPSPTAPPPTPTPLPTATPAPTATVAPTATMAPTEEPTQEPTPPPPTAIARPRIYVVQPGDTLFEIARRFGVPLQELADVNGIEDVRRVYSGQRLVIPER